MHTLTMMSESARELRRTRVLVRCAMLLAIQIVLGLVGSINIGPYIRVSFGYLCTALAGMLYGPVPALCMASAADVIGTIIKPTGPYFFGFTLSAALGGLVYGMCLYGKRVGWRDVLIAKAIIGVAVNVGLNTLWLSMLYGDSYMVLVPMRLVKNAIQLAVDFALLLPLLTWVQNTRTGQRLL